LTKADIAEFVYSVHGGLSKKEAYEFVDKIFLILKEHLLAGDTLRISGFGTFKLVTKVEKWGRNPQTGERILISPRKIISFKPSGQFIDKLNKNS
jgi:integration host factor subunit alpha